MHYLISKKIITFLFISVFVATLSVSHAQTVSSVCGAGINLDNPSPLAIVCPIIKVFNILVLGVGGVFVFMVVYGAIKLALSLGDPKGYQGAQQTWFWAVIGLAVVLGFFTILVVLDNILGLNMLTGGPDAIFNNLLQALGGLFSAVGITGL